MGLSALPFISVIVPNHNGEETIGRCLEAAFASEYDNYEIIVVDDCSSDNSAEIIARYPCRFIRIPEHGGASKARNTGAINSRGDVLLFIDADCLLQSDTLMRTAAAYQENGPDIIVGGTYTLVPFDQGFFSVFQSAFIHYSETKNPDNPDYIATHAMLLTKTVFQKSGGFDEDFMPILEDVEFSHRLKKMGYRLRMDPTIQVQHIFNFSLKRSLRNGIRKTKYWSIYSIKNRDVLTDSGTASREFKLNVLTCFINIALLLLGSLFNSWAFALPIILLYGANLLYNRKMAAAFHRAGGLTFAIMAVLYYTLVYPFAVAIGVFSAMFSQHFGLRP